MRRFVLALALVAAGEFVQAGQLRKPDVVFIASSDAVVDAMLKIANVTRNDVVYDLGCGDGKIVIAAAQRYGARGVGIDIDPERIHEANEKARAAGCAEVMPRSKFTRDLATILARAKSHS